MIRRKTTVCGRNKDYIEVEIFPFWDVPKVSRRKRYRETTPQQKHLNDKRAKRFFVRLCECNFGRDDWFLTLTYEDDLGDIKRAEQDVRNFVRRLKTRAKKAGGRVEFVNVIERSAKGRIHHHMLVKKSCNLSREEVESCWQLGWAECKPVFESRKRNLDRLAKYMTKNMQGTRRWTGSRGLARPMVYVSDTAISRKRYQELSLFHEDCVEVREVFQRQYPGYEVVEFENVVNAEYGGNYISVKLRRVETPPSARRTPPLTGRQRGKEAGGVQFRGRFEVGDEKVPSAAED